MNAAVLALIVLAAFALGYHFYSRFLANVVFQLDALRAKSAEMEPNG